MLSTARLFHPSAPTRANMTGTRFASRAISRPSAQPPQPAITEPSPGSAGVGPQSAGAVSGVGSGPLSLRIDIIIQIVNLSVSACAIFRIGPLDYFVSFSASAAIGLSNSDFVVVVFAVVVGPRHDPSIWINMAMGVRSICAHGR